MPSSPLISKRFEKEKVSPSTRCLLSGSGRELFAMIDWTIDKAVGERGGSHQKIDVQGVEVRNSNRFLVMID